MRPRVEHRVTNKKGHSDLERPFCKSNCPLRHSGKYPQSCTSFAMTAASDQSDASQNAPQRQRRRLGDYGRDGIHAVLHVIDSVAERQSN